MTTTLDKATMETRAETSVMNSRGAILKEAARLNVEGLGCLAATDGQGAFTCFRSGLSLINQYLAVFCEENPGEASALEGVTMNPWLTPNMIPGLQDEACFVHTHAFGFTPSQDGITCNGDMHVASIVILFNLALAFHQFGSLTGNKSKLTQACKLYESCANLSLCSSADGGASGIFLGHAVGLFCLNNQAQILYRFLGDQNSALSLLATMSGKVDALSNVMDTPIRALFEDVMLNAVIIPAAPVLGTPAA